MKKRKLPGHYCKICGRRRPNEKYTSSGYTSHICKDCAKLPKEKRDEMQTITHIHALPFWLKENQRNWLEKKRSDPRQKVREAAEAAYEDRFGWVEEQSRADDELEVYLSNNESVDGNATVKDQTDEAFPADTIPSDEDPGDDTAADVFPDDRIPADQIPADDASVDAFPADQISADVNHTEDTAADADAFPADTIPTDEDPVDEAFPAEELPANEHPVDRFPTDSEFPGDRLPDDGVLKDVFPADL